MSKKKPNPQYLHIRNLSPDTIKKVRNARATYARWEKKAELNPKGLTNIGMTNERYFAYLNQKGKPPTASYVQKLVSSGNAGKIGSTNILSILGTVEQTYKDTDRTVRKVAMEQKKNLARNIPSIRPKLKGITLGDFTKINWDDPNIVRLLFKTITPRDGQIIEDDEEEATAEYIERRYLAQAWR